MVLGQSAFAKPNEYNCQSNQKGPKKFCFKREEIDKIKMMCQYNKGLKNQEEESDSGEWYWKKFMSQVYKYYNWLNHLLSRSNQEADLLFHFLSETWNTTHLPWLKIDRLKAQLGVMTYEGETRTYVRLYIAVSKSERTKHQLRFLNLTWLGWAGLCHESPSSTIPYTTFKLRAS